MGLLNRRKATNTKETSPAPTPAPAPVSNGKLNLWKIPVEIVIEADNPDDAAQKALDLFRECRKQGQLQNCFIHLPQIAKYQERVRK